MSMKLDPLEVTIAQNRVHEVLDAEYYHGDFFQHTEDGPTPDFIGLAAKIVEDLQAAGVHIPATITPERAAVAADRKE